MSPAPVVEERVDELPAATPSGVPAPPPEAAIVFGDHLGQAERFAALLCGPGMERGLLGPREIDRIWPRHLLNCAVVTELLPQGAHVVDVGSGAGLPGVALAVRRPDLRITLVEPMTRRVEFLELLVSELDLTGVDIVVGRAEDRSVGHRLGPAAFVTARAVARLSKLAGWCLPLLREGGELLALKGRTAEVEVAELVTHHALSVQRAEVVTCGSAVLAEPTIVVRVVRGSGRRVQA